MKYLSVFLLMLLFAADVLAADHWGVFSQPFPVRDVIAYGNNGIMLATDGGIRYRTPDEDKVYHSEHGLETSAFRALVSSDIGVYAVSEFGLIAKFNPETSLWKVVNRSYVGNNVRIVPGAAEISGNVMVMGFSDRVAFCDLSTSNSILTIDRIGAYELMANPVKNLAIHGDTLYVKTEQAVFARVMPWSSLSSDVRLSDPNSWIMLPADQFVEEFEAQDKSAVVVNGETLTDSLLYDGDTTVVQWMAEGIDGYFLVGSSLIGYYPKGSAEAKVEDLSENLDLPIGSTYELVNLPTGGVMVASESGLLSTGNITGWNPPYFAYKGVGSLSTVYTSRIKVLSSMPDGYMFFHIWGVSYQMFSHGGNEVEYEYLPSNTSCLDTFVTNYSVSSSVVPAPDNSGFLTATASNQGYSIVYFTKDGDVLCDSHVGSGTVPGAMYALLDEDGSWRIFVGSKKSTGYAEEGNLDVFKYPAPKSNGGVLANGELHSFKMNGPIPVDMAYDSVGGYLWMVSMANLFYFDDENDTLMTPSSMNGLRMAEYTSIAPDVHGNLWVGSFNQGAYRLTPKGGSPDTLSVVHYKSRNGLLSDEIFDVAIDPVYGVAWFSHQNGVSYYMRNDLRDARKNMTDSSKVEFKAYPVPFRPKVHARFTIEGITESSVVSIYNRGGALIKSFRNEDLLGGKLEWDGCYKPGHLVAPGVYYYVVNDGSKNKKGKFIIIH